ncbi:MAG TPA: cysteine synthase A, partial [Longimicrobium sp.]|nr:cysteine synthase A [Longimicrobium sp.]
MPRSRIYRDVTETVGDTPLIQLNRLAAGLPGRVVVKHEGFNPFNSVKDRIGAAMVDDAIERGVLKPGMVIVEPTSGNTGIGIAYVAAARGFRCILTMPETMTVERRNMLRALGCRVVLTEGPKGMKGAIARAEEIAGRLGERAWVPRQFDNPANPSIHYKTTGPEIWEDTKGEIDVFVSGVGTGGTITGAGRYLREKKPGIRIVAVEPAESPVLSGGAPSPHKQQGIGAGFVPGNLDTAIYDEVVRCTNDDAIATARRLAREEA